MLPNVKKRSEEEEEDIDGVLASGQFGITDPEDEGK